METEERLKRLENAVRTLSSELIETQKTSDERAALLIGMEQLCLSMLPLISAPEPMIRSVLVIAYDSIDSKLDKADDEFRAAARRALDVFSAAILQSSDIRAKLERPDSDRPAAP
ncbi:hypothetical protein [Thiobacillus sp. 65-1402]|uniref:hypothetical protein n=1 Tax=Thiobacillus sp. 65-1402 TaxID=1895861 RepID=UPI0009665080|nr:hypothetical protein [Thiobacillus sp. 65-1402]OJW77997.1 MAG: hypothetical protein BGO62_10520 [Thiobacillus sp. 65-1402]